MIDKRCRKCKEKLDMVVDGKEAYFNGTKRICKKCRE